MANFSKLFKHLPWVPIATGATVALMVASYYLTQTETPVSDDSETCDVNTSDTNILDDNNAEILPEYDAKRLNQSEVRSAITIYNWKSFRGFENKDDIFTALVQFFDAEYQRLGKHHLLASYLPDLIDGACGAAFHGLIETGWAVSNGDPQNIAEGLAYFTMSYQNIGPIALNNNQRNADTSVTDYLLETLDRIKKDGKLEVPSYAARFNYEDRMAALSATGQLSHYDVDFSQFDDETHWLITGQISNVLAHLYLVSNQDFFMLRAVTGFYALLQLLPYLYQNATRLQALSNYWRAINAIYVMNGCPDVYSLNINDVQESNVSWEYLNTLAIKRVNHQDKEDLIKTINALQQLEKIDHPQSIYRKVALEVLEHY